MIRYRLQCDKGHEFEGWFRNADTFDRQVKRKQVGCPNCGSTDVAKALMAPSVVTSESKARAPRAAPATSEPGQPVSGGKRVANATQRELLAAMRKLRDELIAKSEYVGPRFAEEARKIHNEEVEARGIYGEATPTEVKELTDEGVEIYPIPILPEDHN
ncbi:MAG TPA: DUF1178 family protein [Hyphomicrobiaceae bacterium]|nr:DUF1178 family protein [Hyphomicrobiaceae bacterium]